MRPVAYMGSPMSTELDRYFMLLDRLCVEAQEIETGILPWLEARVDSCDSDALEALSLRQGLLTSHDRERVEGLLESGFFPFASDETRSAALMLTFEVEDRAAAVHVVRQCERYSASQPLFRELPALLANARKEELVPISEMEIRSDGIVAIGGVFARLGPFVPVAVIDHIRAEHPRAPLFVRLDPYFVDTTSHRRSWWRPCVSPQIRTGGVLWGSGPVPARAGSMSLTELTGPPGWERRRCRSRSRPACAMTDRARGTWATRRPAMRAPIALRQRRTSPAWPTSSRRGCARRSRNARRPSRSCRRWYTCCTGVTTIGGSAGHLV